MFVGKLILKVHPIAAIEEAHDDNVYKPQLLMTLACSCGFAGPTSPLLKLNNFCVPDSKVTKKKKKKKSTAESQEAEDVKKLPDEIVPSNYRPGLWLT